MPKLTITLEGTSPDVQAVAAAYPALAQLAPVLEGLTLDSRTTGRKKLPGAASPLDLDVTVKVTE